MSDKANRKSGKPSLIRRHSPVAKAPRPALKKPTPPAAGKAGTPAPVASPANSPLDKIVADGITFDDVLLLPRRSGVM
ncbi:MAG: hypothetical protein ACK58T_25050, partial [Phycisphaerae bacterium]